MEVKLAHRASGFGSEKPLVLDIDRSAIPAGQRLIAKLFIVSNYPQVLEEKKKLSALREESSDSGASGTSQSRYDQL